MDVSPLATAENARIALVANPGARRGGSMDECVRLLREAGVRTVETYPVTEDDDLDSALRRAVERAPDLLVVGGGDGTISTAAAHVAGTDVVLGVLPLGTANDFARTLEMPDDPAEAIAALVSGKIVDVDLGRTGDAVFLNVASLGLSVEVTERLTPGLKRRLGPAAYPLATLLAYRRHRPFTAWLEFPDGDHDPVRLDDLLQVAIGNGRHYGGGNTVAPNASVDDHLLDVFAIEKGRLRDHVSIARLLKDGSFVEHEQVSHFTTRAVHVHTDVPMPVNLDGEITDPTPRTFRVDANALHVAVPATSRAATLDGPGPDAG